MAIRYTRNPSKYRNKKIAVDGQKFDSIHEYKFWLALRLREKAGEITGLKTQEKFELAPAVRIGGRLRPPLRYYADFVYTELGRQVVADAKGVITEGYRIKRHLMMSVHGIEILEFKTK